MTSDYLVDLIVLLAAAVIVVPACQVVKLGAVPGFLIAGLMVGPAGLGLIDNLTEIRHLAEIGIAFLLFVIGIELKPSRLWQMKRLVFGLGSLQVVLTGMVFTAIAYYVFDLPSRAVLIIGPALALSSTAFVLQLLSEQRLLRSTYGRTSFSILLLQDLAVVPLLALVSLMEMPSLNLGGDIGFALVEALIILILVILSGRYFFHPILHRIAQTKIPEVFTASAILIVLGVSLVAEHINLSMAMGAFMAGMLMSDSSYKHQVVSEIKPFRGLLLGLFFMSMGMSLNLNLLFEKPWLTLGLVLSLVILKVVILFPLVCLFGLEKRKSFAVSIILAQSGEFGLVLFAMASESEIITAVVHQQLLLVILISLLITPVLSNWANSILAKNKSDDDVPVEKVPKSAIVIAGFGRVGHRIGEILNQAGQSFVGIDVDAAIVDQARSDGLPVFYGDVCNQSLLDSIGAKEASVIIITLDDLEATKLIVSTLRAANPTLSIYVRGHNSAECIELQTLGATEVVSENIEASLELARMGLSAINVDDQERERVLQNYARRYYDQIKRAIK